MLLAVVIYAILDAVKNGGGKNLKPFNSQGFLEMVGFSVFSYEGTGVVIPIAKVCKVPDQFNNIVFWVLTTVMIIYISFGEICYFAYGERLE